MRALLLTLLLLLTPSLALAQDPPPKGIKAFPPETKYDRFKGTTSITQRTRMHWNGVRTGGNALDRGASLDVYLMDIHDPEKGTGLEIGVQLIVIYEAGDSRFIGRNKGVLDVLGGFAYTAVHDDHKVLRCGAGLMGDRCRYMTSFVFSVPLDDLTALSGTEARVSAGGSSLEFPFPQTLAFEHTRQALLDDLNSQAFEAAEG